MQEVVGSTPTGSSLRSPLVGGRRLSRRSGPSREAGLRSSSYALDQQEATIYLTESVLTWDPEQYERGYVGGMISEHWYNPPGHRGAGSGRWCFNPVHGGRSNAVFVDGHGGSFDTARQDCVDEGDADCLWDWH